MTTETLADALEREHREIDAGIEKFEANTGEDPATSMRQAMDALRRHIYLEEEFLFPPMRAAGLMGPIMVMLREHGQMWRTMDALQAQMNDGASSSKVQDASFDLVTQLQSHNPKEEQILYPQAEHILGAQASGELLEFMASGQMPSDWVCESAR